MIGISAFMEEAPQSFLAPFTMWGHKDKVAVLLPRRGSSKSLTMVAP